MRYEGVVYRPPGEWRSLLIQLTIGCPHNKCTFCGMYKKEQFRVRPLEEILRDIDGAALNGIAYEKIFLCDGDSLALKTDKLLPILRHIKKAFPASRLISTYGGPKSILRKTPEELLQLREAGLGRVYLGLESGSDKVLGEVLKGVSSAQMLEAGRKLVEAGMDLWVMVLIGLAGREGSKEHILATADIVNKMKPQHLSALTYTPVPGTALYDKILEDRHTVLNPTESLEETRLLIENISIEGLHFTSDHASNYLPLKGSIKEDAPLMLKAIDEAISGERRLRPEYIRGL